MKRTEFWVLIIYSAVTIKFLWPFIENDGYVLATAMKESVSSSFLALFIGAFLNAALVIYCLHKSKIAD